MTTLGYALLGVLARGPASGYDLARQLQAPIGFFWRARHSQIYPELARLEAQGHVSHEVVTQQDHPDKKVYTITPQGQAALRAWATEPVEAAVMRDEFLLKTYCLWLAEPAAALALFHDHERIHAEQLRVYEGLREQLEQKGDEITRHDSPWFATYVTLHRGLRYEREYVEWCRWVIELLEQP
ncbi:MAG TPA: PadR family transcriptional regulator [Roseiflexaceae bacterium]|nr:PadR family transcriptional regulator [Roseiflexaceae bacterium]